MAVQKKLERELERLKRATGVGDDLDVTWLPRYSDLSGEVRGSTIYVYERDEGRAVETLRHEFLDYLVSRAVEPYRQACNALVRLVNDICYRNKEEVVSALVKLLREEK